MEIMELTKTDWIENPLPKRLLAQNDPEFGAELEQAVGMMLGSQQTPISLPLPSLPLADSPPQTADKTPIVSSLSKEISFNFLRESPILDSASLNRELRPVMSSGEMSAETLLSESKSHSILKLPHQQLTSLVVDPMGVRPASESADSVIFANLDLPIRIDDVKSNVKAANLSKRWGGQDYLAMKTDAQESLPTNRLPSGLFNVPTNTSTNGSISSANNKFDSVKLEAWAVRPKKSSGQGESLLQPGWPGQGDATAHSFQSGTIELTGQVVSGPMARGRLATDTVLNLNSGIQKLTLQGGGEIKIRLKPENLGEIHLRIISDGKQVGLHFQVPDEKVKRILEESMGALKDHLSSQQLILSQVNLQVQETAPTGFTLDASGSEARTTSGNENFSNFMGSGFQQQQRSGDSPAWAGLEREWSSPEKTYPRWIPTPHVAESGRIDVRV